MEIYELILEDDPVPSMTIAAASQRLAEQFGRDYYRQNLKITQLIARPRRNKRETIYGVDGKMHTFVLVPQEIIP